MANVNTMPRSSGSFFNGLFNLGLLRLEGAPRRIQGGDPKTKNPGGGLRRGSDKLLNAGPYGQRTMIQEDSVIDSSSHFLWPS